MDCYNSYYTYLLCDGTNYVPSLADGTVSPAKWYNGKAVCSAPAAPIGSATHEKYTVSGITPYANGITRTVGDATTFYYGGGDIVSAPYVDENGDNASHAATACTGSKTLAVQLQGRTLYKDGNWNTLCLPFDVALAGSPLEGATVKELLTTSNLNNGTLTLNFSDNLTAIEAGKPYIVNWAKADGYDEADPEIRDVKNPVFTGVTVSSTSNNEGFSWDGDGVESDDY